MQNDTAVATRIADAIKIIASPQNDNTSEANKKITKPTRFDLSLLDIPELHIYNTKSINAHNKTIFFDCFYQGCYPCVESYPFVEAIFDSGDTNLVVIGIDAVLSDTLYAREYLKKYNINYPVIMGALAGKISDSLKISAWPTFVIVEPDGSISAYQEGFYRRFLKKTRKKYLRKY